MTIDHEWPVPPTADDRCVRCGTMKALHDAKPQNCVPQWAHGEERPRAIHTGQSGGDFAADDAATISARLRELEAERDAARNAPLAPSAPSSPQP